MVEATQPGTAVAAQPAGGAVAAYDYGAYAGAGFEGTTAADFKPSFLQVLGGTSPALETVKGAKPGLIIDSVTNDLYDSVLVVPAVHEHVFVAWKPRTPDGGGAGGSAFGGVYQTNDKVVVEALKLVVPFSRGADGKLILPEVPGGEFQLVETVYFHGVQVLGDAGLVPVSIAFYSTGLTVAKEWYTTMRRLTIPGTVNAMPLFAHVSKLGTEKSTRGSYTWYNFAPSWANGDAISSRLAPDSELFKAGAAVYDAFKSGNSKVDYAQGGNAPAGGSDTTADKAVPF
jgi:hypothetical protein